MARVPYPVHPVPMPKETWDLMERALRKRVIAHLHTARRADEACLKQPDRWTGLAGMEDPVYTEHHFLSAELLGMDIFTVPYEQINMFLIHMDAERIRPNVFIHQWAKWRESHRSVT